LSQNIVKVKNSESSKEDLDKVRNIDHPDFKSQTISTLYEIEKGVNGLERALEKCVKATFKAIKEGYNIIILSDRGVSDKMAPIPMLLACSYVHHSMNILKVRSLGSSLSPPNLVNRIISPYYLDMVQVP
jgi:glutamate synthase (ferredoxin)